MNDETTITITISREDAKIILKPIECMSDSMRDICEAGHDCSYDAFYNIHNALWELWNEINEALKKESV